MAFNDSFYQEVLDKKREFENLSQEQQVQFSNLDFDSNELNCEISYSEVSKAIDRAKNGMAYLEVPNEVLKNENAKVILHKFFNLCFQMVLIPQTRTSVT